MDFYNSIGLKGIGSRLRLLTTKITDDSAQIYKLYTIDMQPKWFPVFYSLSEGDEKTITGIALEIGHSHPSVSKIISEMIKEGIVVKKENSDGRRSMVALSEKGIQYKEKIQEQYQDVENAIKEISAQATHDLWEAIKEWEFLLDQKTLVRRVAEQKKLRESNAVRIIDFEPQYAAAFRKLNEEWISSYFKIEQADIQSLEDPKGYILDKGGHIFIALLDNEPVGTCALMAMNDGEHDFELAKMAVSPIAQGKSIGWLLGQTVLDKAADLGAKKVYLESNTVLKPAINLYHKLGFRKIAGHATPYERCNIQMAINLSNRKNNL
ncbi:bifunctional helix-turn-helix transcriptional regulator/GNAT family N-acetyltransferase [Chryseobacterium luteum]|uniref:MarR family transcriptional regulator n=1 Tax=Chryseobacterium luteum TaxID=421531 RepID=A0A085YXM8_9FLAO|nr:GNAT family N-acetyltransferase [Chryseobacterium luteum]KFE96941.1 MarR family transcriptional regulator [Chryseobacterium luteum]